MYVTRKLLIRSRVSKLRQDFVFSMLNIRIRKFWTRREFRADAYRFKAISREFRLRV